ncbi:aminotransferase class I/II-fold pyridoxal phosphate-dependent enzyme [Methylocaldum sp. MU1018]
MTAPGLRVGYLASSPELLSGLIRLKQSGDLHTNRIGQAWLTRFLASAEFDEHRARMIRVYGERRDAMQTALLRHFEGLAEWRAPAGGLFFWLRLTEERDTLAALQASLTRDVAFMPGDPFFPAKDLRYPALRLNFSHAAPENIEKGIARLAEILGERPE